MPDEPVTLCQTDPDVAAGAAAGQKRKRLRTLVSLAFFVAVAIYITRSLAAGIAQVDWKTVDISWPDLGVSLFFAVLTNFLVAESNRNLITATAPSLSRRRIYSAILISRLGRYIPGKVATVAGAGLLMRKNGVSLLATTSMVLLNALLNNMLGLILGLPLLIGPLFGHRANALSLSLGAAAMVFGIIALHPRVGLPLLVFIVRRLSGKTLQVSLPTGELLKSLLSLVLQWLAAGASLWFVFRALGGQADGFLLLQCTSAASLAVTLGFLSLFAPGGLGVREWVFLGFLTPLAGAGPAAVMTVCMRLVHVGADVVCAAAGSLLGRRE